MPTTNLRAGVRFPPEALTFLSELKKNNRRPWFQARKAEYERSLKEPMAEIVQELARTFRRIAPEIVVDPKTSTYRIYRDTRFSPDKTPYKTHIAAVFPVRGLAKSSGPGFYFHLSPEELLVGGGIYSPDPELLRAVREHIAHQPKAFLGIVESKAFRAAFGKLEGERLRSMPKGFSVDHPAAEYLRYKQFLFGAVYPPKIALSPKLVPKLLETFRKGLPLIRFLKQPALRAASLSQDRAGSHKERSIF